MSFSSGVFSLVAGNPVVTGTTISSTVQNNTMTDVATGLSTCLLKDGTQTATASVDFAQGLSVATNKLVVSSLGVLTGTSSMLSPITNSLAAPVSLNNNAVFFDGPSVAQGTSGTWFVSGHVMVYDSGASTTMTIKLWDGTTVISSTQIDTIGSNLATCVHLSGFKTSPAGNLRISVKDGSNTGSILSNNSGLGHDSTITAFRIG